MAHLACLAAGMLFRIHLRKPNWFREIGRVTTSAEHRSVWKLRNHIGWVFGVLRLRTVAGFTIDARVLTRLFRVNHVAVTVFADLVTGVRHWSRPDLRQSGAAEMPILTKGFRNQ